MKKQTLVIMPKLNPVIPGLVSDELYDASIGMLNKDPMRFNHYYKTKIIHLIDSVSRGYTSPMEAYDAINAKYFPEHLTVRESTYRHLIR